MASSLYDFLHGMGYHHPFHPMLVHIPVGLAIAGFFFIILAVFFKKSRFDKTAKHCNAMTLLFAIPAAAAGYLDWDLFYKGAWIFPIIAKMILGAIFFILLVLLAWTGSNDEENKSKRVLLHFAVVLIVTGIGYFGGELVYGQKKEAPMPETVTESTVVKGQNLFEENCSVCHYTDRHTVKIGPGLKGLFEREELPASGKSVSAQAVRDQLNTPFKDMPAFENLSDDQIKFLTDYLKTL